MNMKLKRFAAAALAAVLLFCAAPFMRYSAAETTAEITAQLTPDAITKDGITLSKTAVRTSATSWDVTLTIDGGGTVQAHTPIDVVLLLDCSSSMSRTENGQTRLDIAKAAAKSFIAGLADKGVNANVSLAGFSGTAAQMTDFTNVLQNGTANTDGINALGAAIDSNWYVATSTSGSPYYGNSGGTNIIKALSVGQSILKSSANSTKYLVLLSDGTPSVYGDDEKSSWREGEYYMSSEDIELSSQKDAQGIINSSTLTRVFAVGFNVGNMQPYASENSAYTADGTTLAGVFDSISSYMQQTVQNGVVTDVIGERFAYVSGSAVFQPSGVGTGAQQPEVTISDDRRTLTWFTGAWLEAGKTATLKYSLILNDPELAGAGGLVPLNEGAKFDYTELSQTHTPQEKSLDFPIPKDIYEAGSLRVFSTGLPEGSTGTQQQSRLMCTDGALFDVLPPMGAPESYALKYVKLNGTEMTPNDFETQYHYALPVVKGETVVEYHYEPKGTEGEMWTYSVEYYVNGKLMPSWTYSSTISAADPVVTSVDTRLSSLPNFYEYPVLQLPYTLKYNGEVLKVYYVAVQLPAAKLHINHTYLKNGTAVEGNDSADVEPFEGEALVESFLQREYSGQIYTLVSAKVYAVDANGAQTDTVLLEPSSVITAEDGFAYTLNIIYNRTETDGGETPDPTPTPTPTPDPEPENPPETVIPVTPVEVTGTLPKTQGSTVFMNTLLGLFAMGVSVLLQTKIKR